MDVIRAHEGASDMRIRMERLRASPSLSELITIERDILDGDWGGYHDAFIRPLITELDKIREDLNLPVPYRNTFMRRLFTRSTLIDAKEIKTNTTCAICLDVLTLENCLEVRTCEHQYHTQCIHLWSRHRTSCPLCNGPI